MNWWTTKAGCPTGPSSPFKMEHFDRMMDIAKREKLRRIVFIHGVGQGVCVTKSTRAWSNTIRTAHTARRTRGVMGLGRRKFGWAKRPGASRR